MDVFLRISRQGGIGDKCRVSNAVSSGESLDFCSSYDCRVTATAALVVSVIDGDGGVVLLPRADLLRRLNRCQINCYWRNSNNWERGVRWDVFENCDLEVRDRISKNAPSSVRREEIKAVIRVAGHDANAANLGSSRPHLDRAVDFFLTNKLSFCPGSRVVLGRSSTVLENGRSKSTAGRKFTHRECALSQRASARPTASNNSLHLSAC